MASANTLNIEQNGYRSVIINATQVSDGTDGESVTIYNAASATFGVNRAGQVFLPGIYTKVVGLDYDVQDMRIALRWEATADQDIAPLGSAPEDFDWRKSGGIRVPSGLAGATGSIKVVSLDPTVGATYFVRIYLWKGVPQS